MKALLLALLILPAGTLTAPAQAAPVRAPHVEVELVADHEAVAPGQEFRAGIRFRLEKGWHVYWKNAGDSGESPRAQWTLPAGMTAGDFQWPVPRRINVGPLTNFGYEDEILLPVPMRAPATGGPELRMEADARWLVCKEECVPGKAKLTHSVLLRESGGVSDAQWSPVFAATERMLPAPLPTAWRATGYREGGELRLNVGGVAGVTELLDFFPVEGDVVSHPALPRSERSGSTLDLRLKLAGNPRAPERNDPKAPVVSGVLVFATADGGTRAYETEFRAAMPMGEGLLWPILFAFLGGLLLNLMPCVFPVLSIKALSLVKLSGSGHRGEMIRQGWAYAAGVVISFWILVAALLLVRVGGRQVGWGFQLQSPAFVFLMASLLFAMGLNLLGVFEVGGKLMGAGGKLAGRSGPAGSFFTGMLATLVATPCTAPFMGSAIGYALAQPTWVVFAVFTSLALGLAAPYVLLSYMPGIGRVLPRPGRWMESFKQAMAFPLFAAVIWLAWVLGLQTSTSGLLALMGAFILVGLAAWLGSRWPRLALLAAALGIGSVIAGADYARKLTPAAAAVKAESELDWEKYSPELLAKYREQGRPIFVDFTAAWCVACQVNELAVFGSAEVRAKLKQLGFALLKADWTNEDPVVTEALASFGRSGVPFYVIYGKGRNSPPQPLPEVITPGLVLAELEKIK